MRSSDFRASRASSSATLPAWVSSKPDGPRSHRRTPRVSSTSRTWRLMEALDMFSCFSAAAQPLAWATAQKMRRERKSRAVNSGRATVVPF
ncbi:hypothetical protein G6F60_015733 [Rhizopus arrhizus]|nr:hypothetical protein G6F60_015733 [Rhizopus arrhizus]